MGRAERTIAMRLEAIDTWVQHEFALRFETIYARHAGAAAHRYAKGGFPALRSLLAEQQTVLEQKHINFQRAYIWRATATALDTVAEHVEAHFGLIPAIVAAEADPLVVVELTPRAKTLDAELLPLMREELFQQPDAWNLTYSQRLWKHHQALLKELQSWALDYDRNRQTLQDGIARLRRFVRSDADLPRHLQDVERAARAMLKNVPGARDDFIRLIEKARRVLREERRPGPRGVGTFSRTLLNDIERAVRNGNKAAIKQAMTTYVDARAKYRALTLARSEAHRASQQTNLRIFQRHAFVQAVRWNLSQRRRHFDECDIKARADVGLGPGVYYKQNVPWPDHPNGGCFLTAALVDPAKIDEEFPPEPANAALYEQTLADLRGPLAQTANRLGRQKTLDRTAAEQLLSRVRPVPPAPGRTRPGFEQPAPTAQEFRQFVEDIEI